MASTNELANELKFFDQKLLYKNKKNEHAILLKKKTLADKEDSLAGERNAINEKLSATEAELGTIRSEYKQLKKQRGSLLDRVM